MEKIYSIIPDDKFDKIVFDLIELFGLPEIQRKLSVYTYHKNNNQLHINFIDQRCDIKYIPHTVNHEPVPPIFIENKNLKELFHTVRSLGFNKVNVGFIISINFNTGDKLKVNLSQDTFADNIAEIKYVSDDTKLILNVKSIFHKNKIPIISRDELKEYINKQKYRLGDLFDQFGCLNSKIRKYGEMVGIDVLSNTRSLRSRLKKFSNDYGMYEKWFFKITNGQLNGNSPTHNTSKFFKPVSIVISCFNSSDTIYKTLCSIESQRLTVIQKNKIEVIIVDDGSETPVQDILKNNTNDFNFNIKIIRLEKNSGLSTARNIGILSSSNNHIILLDSDILLSKNYLLEHSVRNQLIPHAAFVSFKKNIDSSSKIASVNNIKKGLDSPTDVDDLRTSKIISHKQLGIHQFNESATVQILNDTDYFKSFGFGRTIGIYDLASMVIGHNISTRRKTLDRCKYFSNNFVGWGLEDSYFGAKIIANGNYVIPVLSSNVYHINHAPRSGSNEKKAIELKDNIDIYNNLLDKDFV